MSSEFVPIIMVICKDKQKQSMKGNSDERTKNRRNMSYHPLVHVTATKKGLAGNIILTNLAALLAKRSAAFIRTPIHELALSIF